MMLHCITIMYTEGCAQKSRIFFAERVTGSLYQYSVYCIGQGCPTRGPQAACGPLEEFVRPFIVLSSFTAARQKE